MNSLLSKNSLCYSHKAVRNRNCPRISSVDLPTDYALTLARMVANTSWLPDPGLVAQFPKEVFPSARANKGQKRRTKITIDGMSLLLDDNCTPMWAFMWGHGFAGISRQVPDYSLAHIYPSKDYPHTFTHLANLLLVPKFFAGLTDNDGPLVPYLKYHSHVQYGWTPLSNEGSLPIVLKPQGYDSIQWRYLESETDIPRDFIESQLKRSNDVRAKILREIRESEL